MSIDESRPRIKNPRLWKPFSAEKIGKRLRHSRTLKGMTQAELAKRCGWPNRSRISNYEAGRKNLSIESLNLLSSILNIDPEWLCFGEGEDNNAMV